MPVDGFGVFQIPDAAQCEEVVYNAIKVGYMRLLVRRINVHENEDGSLDVTLEFNGDFKDTSTVCFEINE